MGRWHSTPRYLKLEPILLATEPHSCEMGLQGQEGPDNRGSCLLDILLRDKVVQCWQA